MPGASGHPTSEECAYRPWLGGSDGWRQVLVDDLETEAPQKAMASSGRELTTKAAAGRSGLPRSARQGACGNIVALLVDVVSNMRLSCEY